MAACGMSGDFQTDSKKPAAYQRLRAFLCGFFAAVVALSAAGAVVFRLNGFFGAGLGHLGLLRED